MKHIKDDLQNITYTTLRECMLNSNNEEFYIKTKTKEEMEAILDRTMPEDDLEYVDLFRKACRDAAEILIKRLTYKEVFENPEGTLEFLMNHCIECSAKFIKKTHYSTTTRNAYLFRDWIIITELQHTNKAKIEAYEKIDTRKKIIGEKLALWNKIKK